MWYRRMDPQPLVPDLSVQVLADLREGLFGCGARVNVCPDDMRGAVPGHDRDGEWYWRSHHDAL